MLCTDVHEEIPKVIDLAIHELSGCDTASHPLGKVKMLAVNLLLKLDLVLQVFTDSSAQEEDRIKAEISFLSYVFSGETIESLALCSSVRRMIFQRSRAYLLLTSQP